MIGRAIRSRLHALRLERQAARLGRDLLDNKREAILRALADHGRRRTDTQAAAADAWRRARLALAAARIELGGRTVDAAALAQPRGAGVEWRAGSVVGVPTPRLTAQVPAFVPQYGAASTSAALDHAGLQYAALVNALVAYAEEDEAVRNLQLGLAKTIRRLKALEEVVLPRLEREARDVAVALEEDERDDTVRSRRAVAYARAEP